MPQSMQVVRGLLAANPDYWPAKTNADGTTSSAYLRATVYEDRPRVRQKDGSYTDNPLGPVRTTVKFWGQAAELLHGMDFRQGDAVVATGRMGDPDAFISQKDGKAYARPVVIGDSMQIDSIVSQRIQLARERKRQNKEQAGAVADAGLGKRAVENDLVALCIRVFGFEDLGGSRRTHRVGAGGAFSDFVKIADGFHSKGPR